MALPDQQLMQAMGPTPALAKDNLLDALERAVARGTLLHVLRDPKKAK